MSLPKPQVSQCPKCLSKELEGYQGQGSDETLCQNCGWTSEDRMAVETMKSGVPLLY